jgi:hypothetical protein
MPWGWAVEHVIKDWLCVARPILLGPRVGSSWGLLPDQRSPLQRLRVKCATCRGDVWHTGNTFWEKPMNCSYRYCRSHIVTQEISRSHAWLSRLAQVEHLEIGIMNPRRSCVNAERRAMDRVASVGWAMPRRTCLAMRSNYHGRGQFAAK